MHLNRNLNRNTVFMRTSFLLYLYGMLTPNHFVTILVHLIISILLIYVLSSTKVIDNPFSLSCFWLVSFYLCILLNSIKYSFSDLFVSSSRSMYELRFVI